MHDETVQAADDTPASTLMPSPTATPRWRAGTPVTGVEESRSIDAPTGSPSTAPIRRAPRNEAASWETDDTICRPFRPLTGWTWDIFVEWSPDGGEVYFSQGPELFAVSADGSAVRSVAQAWAPAGPQRDGTLTPGVGTMIPFDVSPDGTQVAFATCGFPYPGALDEDEKYLVYGAKSEYYAYGYELALVSTRGGAPRRLTANREVEGQPEWSPDGRRIAFAHALSEGVGFPGDVLGLSTMAVDGTDVRLLVASSHLTWPRLRPPAWSPDGTQLAFIGSSTAGSALFVVDVTGGAPRRVAYTLSEPAWSPDGRRLVYSKVERDSDVGVYTITAHGTDAQRVAKISGWDWDVRAVGFGAIGSVGWSPDGSKIFFAVNPHRWFPKSLEFYVFDADGTGGRRMAWRWPDRFEARAGAWAPDGSRLAIVAEWVPFVDDPSPFPARPVVVLSMAADGTDIRVLAQGDPGPTGDDIPLPEMEALGSRAAAATGHSASCATDGAVPDPTANPGLVEDCETLLEFQRALRGGESLNWSAAYPIYLWDGVALQGEPLRVSELRLAGRELRGIVPATLGRLAGLRVLSLRDNRFVGPIPTELSRLRKLETLHLHRNYIGGSVPAALGDLTNLRYLGLGENNLTGTLPAALGRLELLVSLAIDETLISGPVPASLGGLTQLKRLDLAGNRLSGSIPPQLGRLANLEMLDLSDNQLRGEVPVALGQLANVTEVRLDGNQLTGCIPADLRPVAYQQFNGLGLPRCEAA